MSTKFIEKFGSTMFTNISQAGFFRRLFWYMTDSKLRIKSRLDTFIKEQLDNPSHEMRDMANKFLLDYRNADKRIIEILKFVNKKIRYTSDKINFNKIEYWATADETWRKKKGDCDDINGLIYHLARLSGIGGLQLWNAIGETPRFGHYWLIYFSFKTDKWYAIDGTYHVDLKPISIRNEFKLTPTKYVKVWYLFNEYSSFKGR